MGGEEWRDLLSEYFNELDDHVVSVIHNGKVGDSCFAATMLTCAAIDSLGRLVAPHELRKHAGQRFKYILQEYFPAPYGREKDALWNVRNDLMHNALNVACFLAATQDPDAHYGHLDLVSGTEYLFIDTGAFFEDLVAAIESIKACLADPVDGQRAAGHLEEAYTPWEGPTTAPPLVMLRQV